MHIHSPPPCEANGWNAGVNTALCSFPEEDWAPEYLDEHNKEPDKWLFDPSDLQIDPPTSDLGVECGALLALQKLRSPEREAEIRIQAERALLPLVGALGLHGYYEQAIPKRDELMALIERNVRTPVFAFKRLFLRARPFRVCTLLRPMLPKGGRLYPGHPSYPSAHSTMVYTWAHLLKAKLAPRHQPLGQAMLDAAKLVAENREWAGVHFASDTLAGEDLGKQMATAILQKNSIAASEYELLMPGLT